MTLHLWKKWSVRNKMPFNVAKTKVLHLGRKNCKHDYSLMGTVLNVTKEERDLGVTFNESFSPSINCIIIIHHYLFTSIVSALGTGWMYQNK